jgi:cyclophilin family peptidyl-prolyl cis-trans isomerase
VTFNRPWRMGMTRSTLRRISGVVFFVTATTLPSFIGRHPCFGEVIGGQDVVRAICKVRTQSDGTPGEPIVIQTIRIFKIGAPSPLPEPVPYEPKFEPLKPKP